MNAGDFLFIGFGESRMTAALSKLLRRVRPAGVILFRRNLSTPEGTRKLTDAVCVALGYRPFVAIDQEGGTVSRLRAFGFDFPTALDLARTGRASSAENQARLMGRALRMLGVNVNFAPVVDLSPPDSKNGIGTRSFSTDPAVAARYAGAFLRGLKKEGVLGCLKHFPGLGSTASDSHLTLPASHRSASALLRRDVEPFRLLAKSAPFVMFGHAWYPAFSGKEKIPADLDFKIATTLLRGRAGFRGVALSDDLAMKAVPAWARERHPEAFLAAGCDMLLACEPSDVERTWRTLSKNLAAMPAPFAASLRRVARLRKKLPAAAKFSAREWGKAVREAGWERRG